MAFAVEGDHPGTVVELDDGLDATLAGRAVLDGAGNRLRIRGPCQAHLLQIHLGQGSSAFIESGCVFGRLEIHVLKGGSVRIGRGCAFNGFVRLLVHERAAIEIGESCLFGSDVDVLASDMHAIVDAETGHRLNPARDVSIGDRVWIGYRSIIGKGARIAAGAIVGANSFVSGQVPANTLVAGAPARLLRTNVTWRPELD